MMFFENVKMQKVFCDGDRIYSLYSLKIIMSMDCYLCVCVCVCVRAHNTGHQKSIHNSGSVACVKLSLKLCPLGDQSLLPY